VPAPSGESLTYVDQIISLQPPATVKITNDQITLTGFSAAAVTLP
jgi:hypothetical protein